MSRVRDTLILLLGGGLILGLDQASKQWVRSRLAFGEVWEPIPAISPYFRIVHWENTGAAFGMFPDGGMVFGVIAVVVSAAILYYFPQVPSNHRLLRAALILQFGGALGNLIDRLRQGPVTDFLAFGRFPVFNLADAAISVGVALLILSMWFEEHREPVGEGTVGAQEDSAPEVEGTVG